MPELDSEAVDFLTVSDHPVTFCHFVDREDRTPEACVGRDLPGLFPLGREPGGVAHRRLVGRCVERRGRASGGSVGQMRTDGGLDQPAAELPIGPCFLRLNYRDAFDFVSQYLQGGGPVTEGLIREIHNRLVVGVRGGAAAPGEYRKVRTTW